MSTFIIRNKETLEQWTAQSGKSSWKKANHAKAAFANSRGINREDPLLSPFVKGLGKYESLKFNDQSVYEVLEVYSTSEKRYAEIERKFKEIVDELYGKGYSISGFHMNGDLEPLDNFFEENNWFIEN